MRRVWVVDDHIPIHALYGGPYPSALEADLVRHLVDNQDAGVWEEAQVLELCRALCAPPYESTFFLTPEAMLLALDRGALAPHAVVFDWQYPGSTPERNLEALERLLGSTFAYVQVYTHIGEEGVQPLLTDLTEKYPTRLLPPKTKATVSAAQLSEQVTAAWEGTIAGVLADRVRHEVRAAVERTLIDVCEIGRGTIAAMSQGEPDIFIHVVLSKVRDEIGLRGADALEQIISGNHADQSSEGLQRLMSIWYYSFPSDQRVRCGDLIEIDGYLGFVVTPPCDLAGFNKKTGKRLTWLRTVRLDQAGLDSIRQSGLKLNTAGNSIVATHGSAGDAVVLLPNVPLAVRTRQALGDFALLCHAWESRTFEVPPNAPGGELTYPHLTGILRRCSLADPFASAVVARVSSVMSSPGTPDLPKGEIARLRALLTPPAQPPTAPAAGA